MGGPTAHSLTTTVLNSLGWVFTNMMAKNVLQFVRTVILWRLLTEDDFGLNGMAWLAINGFTILQDMGFQSALVQRRTDLEKAVSVTWYVNVGLRVVIYGILFLVAPWIATHFGEPEVSSILRVASICIVIGSFGSANEALLRKRFQFQRILAVDAVELLVQVVAQIGLAAAGLGVWSLVYGTIASVVARSAMLWWLAPIRVGKFDLAVAKDMFHFGKHMTASTLLLWLIGNMDYYFVGKYLGKGALGFYTLSFKLAYLIATNVARMLGSVLFPAFSAIGNDYGRVRGAWLRAIRYSTALMLPMGLTIIVFAREIVLAFYEARCEVVIVPMAILTVSALCRAVGTPMGDLQKGIGKPSFLTQVVFWQVVVLGPLLLLVTAGLRVAALGCLSLAGLDGLEVLVGYVITSTAEMRASLVGVSLGVAGSTLFIGLGVGLHLTSREIGFTARDVARALRPPLLAGAAMVACGWGTKALVYLLLPDAPFLATLVVLGSISIGIYGGALWLAFPDVIGDLRELLDRRRKERKQKTESAAREALRDGSDSVGDRAVAENGKSMADGRPSDNGRINGEPTPS